MPLGIYLFEIDESFGPHTIAEFYLTEKKLTQKALKNLANKHIKKNLVDATYREGSVLHFSSLVRAEEAEGKLFLGFILKEGEDLLSLKSMFEDLEKEIAENFTSDKKKMRQFLKGILNSILSLMEKLKEPKIIQEKINERTKTLLDNGKLQEARKLIKLGEETPSELSEKVKEGEAYFKDGDYKKARKSYEKAADLAEEIQEEKMVTVLNNKAKKADQMPDLIDKQEDLQEDIEDELDDIEVEEYPEIYKEIIDLLEEGIQVANALGENEKIKILSDFKHLSVKAKDTAGKLLDINKKLRENLKKIV
ncbi:MAG: tetratricopeptide repeat protein [Promethearchaeia archaeon]